MPEWEMPDSISPSRMTLWQQCPLKFRVETIQKVRGGTNAAAVAGTTAHLALEWLMQLPGPERTRERLNELIEAALVEIKATEEYLSLTEAELVEFDAKVRRVTPGAFDLVDVPGMSVASTEQKMEVDLDGWILRGIIDLTEDRDGFGRILWDWKSGKAPAPRYADSAILGLEFYAVMVTQATGEIPAGVGLLYIAHNKSMKRVPTEESVTVTERKILRVRDEIGDSCADGHFPTKTGPLCNWCHVQPYCPAHGGSLDDLPVPVRVES